MGFEFFESDPEKELCRDKALEMRADLQFYSVRGSLKAVFRSIGGLSGLLPELESYRIWSLALSVGPFEIGLGFSFFATLNDSRL